MSPADRKPLHTVIRPTGEKKKERKRQQNQTGKKEKLIRISKPPLQILYFWNLLNVFIL